MDAVSAWWRTDPHALGRGHGPGHGAAPGHVPDPAPGGQGRVAPVPVLGNESIEVLS